MNNQFNFNKKALFSVVISIVIAVLGIILFLLFYYKIITPQQYTYEQQNAAKALEKIKAKINSMGDEQRVEMLVQGFSDEWFLAGWGKNDLDRPDKCFFSSCICICKGKGLRNVARECQANSFCEKLQGYEVIELKEFEGSGGNVKQQGIITFSATSPFKRIEIEKNLSKKSLKIYGYK